MKASSAEDSWMKRNLSKFRKKHLLSWLLWLFTKEMKKCSSFHQSRTMLERQLRAASLWEQGSHQNHFSKQFLKRFAQTIFCQSDWHFAVCGKSSDATLESIKWRLSNVKHPCDTLSNAQNNRWTINTQNALNHHQHSGELQIIYATNFLCKLQFLNLSLDV